MMNNLSIIIRFFKEYNIYQYIQNNIKNNPEKWNNQLNYLWIAKFIFFLNERNATQAFFQELYSQYQLELINKQKETYCQNDTFWSTEYKFYEIFTDANNNHPEDYIDNAFDWEDSYKGTDYWLNMSEDWSYEVYMSLEK